MKVELFLDEGEEYPQLFSVWKVDQKTGRADLTTRRNYVDDSKGWDQWRKTDDENIRLKTENCKLRELIYKRAHEHAIQHMTEDELRITLANALDENAKLRGLLLRSYESFEEVYDRCDIDDPWRMETALEDMRVCMRELGVER